MDGDFASGFQRLQDLQLLDLENRQNKVPGGYQVPLSESRVPFILLNAVGVHMDVVTLLHEGGHAFHTLAARSQPLLAYRSAPLEFSEVASVSMELIGSEYLAEFYSAVDIQRARRTHFEAILASFPWLASVDAFQHWIYTHPGHTRAERTDAWLVLMKRFGGLVDWTGYERVRANLWHDVGHIFQCPFYFVEYGIAALGALHQYIRVLRRCARRSIAEPIALAAHLPACGSRFILSNENSGQHRWRELGDVENLAHPGTRRNK